MKHTIATPLPIDPPASSSTNVSDRSSSDTPVLIAQAVAACARARRHALTFKHAAEQQLRAVREAGRLLSLVHRSNGGRPPKNSSTGLTSYQLALKEAGISRQTATTWRRVADLSDAAFERFIAEARHTLGNLTIAELLRTTAGRPARIKKMRTVTLEFSKVEYAAFMQHLDVLSAAYFTQTPAATLIVVLSRAYASWLASQTSATHPAD